MKKILALMLTVAMALSLTGCNYTLIDTKYQYDYAIISLQDGTLVMGKVDKWTDYDGEQLQVTIEGVTYLTNSYHCTLIG